MTKDISVDTKNIGKFRYFCQKVLPAVYDDSLSYYELLNKVVQYLNDCIDAVNMNSEAIQELANYLSEQDIEAMVAEILEDMKESGELADIINETIFDELNEKIEYIFDSLIAYRGWGGWDVDVFNKNSFIASRAVKIDYNIGDWKVGDQSGNYYLDVKTYNPLPVNELHVAGSCDREPHVTYTNQKYGYGLGFRLYSFVDRRDLSGTAYARIIEHGRRKTIPDECPLTYNNTVATNIVNMAKSYYNAMLNGREFAYGANFFYITPNNIVNDANGKGRMECDTFVGLCLRGIDYEHSPYSVLTPNFTYEYNDMYIDVSEAENWSSGTQYYVDDIVIYNNNYYKCIVENNDDAFSTLNFQQIWVVNSNSPFDVINQTLHPEDEYLHRDIRFMCDYACMGFKQGTIFTDKIFDDEGNFESLHTAKSGDIACWRRVDGKPIIFGGSNQGKGFDSVSHVGIVSVEAGEAYIYHVSSASHTHGHIVDKVAIRDLSDVRYAPPDYFVRPRYIDPVE